MMIQNPLKSPLPHLWGRGLGEGVSPLHMMLDAESHRPLTPTLSPREREQSASQRNLFNGR
jgi:hypothetical protein